MNPVNMQVPPLASQLSQLSPFLRTAIGFCANHHLLPESYLYGLMDVQRVGLATTTFIFGKVYEHGQWFYFPALLSLKWSVGVLGLLRSPSMPCHSRVRRPRESFSPPPIFLCAHMDRLNIGVRQAADLPSSSPRWRRRSMAVQQRRVARTSRGVARLACRRFRDISTISLRQRALGGPTKTHLYFSDSAADWAQQLK
jgi:hypothetical protein